MWPTFLRSRAASLLTHLSLVLLTGALFAVLYRLPFWLAFLPAALLQHRVGVLLHEYIHGIPFRRHRANLTVLSVWDGLLLSWGLAELFRGTHLSHHRWLNTERDPAFGAAREHGRTLLEKVKALEGVQHLIYLRDALAGQHPGVVPSRIAIGAALSAACTLVWIAAGAPAMSLKLMALTAFNTTIPISFRGAIEHHSHPDDPGFANEYRVVIPLFNLNRHIHHHEAPHCPWYLLEYRTPRPLWTLHYFTHWFKVYVWREYVLMKPFRRTLR